MYVRSVTKITMCHNKVWVSIHIFSILVLLLCSAKNPDETELDEALQNVVSLCIHCVHGWKVGEKTSHVGKPFLCMSHHSAD